jgi:hypothetical protein
MAGLLLLLLVAGGVVMLTQGLRPKALPSGEYLHVDHADGPIRNVMGLIVVIASMPVSNALVRGIDPHSVKHPAGWVLIGLVVFGLYAWLIWHFGSRIFEAMNAAPGEMKTDHWPLAAGEHANVTYRRKFYGGVPAGDVHAYLVHYEVLEIRENGRRRKSKREVGRVELSGGDANYRNKELVATWRFQVPNTFGNPIESLLRDAIRDMFIDSYKEKEWWEFQVVVPLRGGGNLDSQFKLKIEMIAGRSVFHLGH